MDRDSLIAAAFLSGSDYDLRGSSTGNGVRGVGVKQAMASALELRNSSQGDTLSLLALVAGGHQVEQKVPSQLVAGNHRCKGCKCCGHGEVHKKIHGKRGCSLCGTNVGCLPIIANGGVCECSYCVDVKAAGGEQRLVGARILYRTTSNASEDPSTSSGAHAVSSQYKRHVNMILPDQGTFCWRTLETNNLKEVLKGVFREGAIDSKLQPLRLEWCLRRLAVAYNTRDSPSVAQRLQWALKENLDYYPKSAKRIPSRLNVFFAPYVIVSWNAVSQNVETPLDLPPSARRTRVALARQCGLLEIDSFRNSTLRVVWKGLLAVCPVDTRKDDQLLLAWGRAHELDLVPKIAIPGKLGKFEIRWNECETGRCKTQATIVVRREEVEEFGLPVTRKLGYNTTEHPQVPDTQRTIHQFFSPRKTPARRTRVALAGQCGLLETDSFRNSTLRVVWKSSDYR